MSDDPERKPVAAAVLNRAPLTESEATDVLRELCAGKGDLYEALSNFILLDPERQSEKLGTIKEEWEKGAKALAQGNKLVARVNFEVAIRLGFYFRDRAGIIKSIEQADLATEKPEKKRLHQILLTNLDEALKIVDEYYSRVYGRAVGEGKAAS